MKVKSILRWAIVGGTLFFLGAVLRNQWAEVQSIRLDAVGGLWLAIALLVTLSAHIWSGWVWSLILRELGQPANGLWGVAVYLRTNIAKYLPGNIWHFLGRIKAAESAGYSTSAAVLSVVLESLLMAAVALALAIAGRLQNWGIHAVILVGLLIVFHPKVLNPLLQMAQQFKTKGTAIASNASPRLQRYPGIPLMGEFGFVSLRATGFLFVLQALQPVPVDQVPALLSAFSFAWLLGLVVPGAPGGLGVFEATAIALIGEPFSDGVVLSGVALYRLISTSAEALGAAFASLNKNPATDTPKI
ncbi:flippase-like domain-containing protein [Oscillatoria sp. FACHB-1407]|uniref:lysylphosphatidylglycerol synthase domain-containing protein n=1 Tax=Oscillatoria sp. FACHB-1407 TaxID=2692847 RepID=UPI001684CD79|nr:lysylphosphatidylglycerol synthase domain-containing protein [Oscillatoria sp. FACHB-1407]MBD2464724.1 flippase-like domain-containing protein [Oscillatoria sp. FACHB-1407]